MRPKVFRKFFPLLKIFYFSYLTLYTGRYINTAMEKTTSKETILQNALTLFAEKGFDSVGIAEICESAQITKPTLYYFFKSKDGLLEEILKNFLVPLNQNLRQWGAYEPVPDEYEKDVYALLTRICNGLFEYMMQNRDFALLFVSVLIAPPDSKTAQIAQPLAGDFNEFFTEVFYKISSVHKNVKNKEMLLGWLFSTQLMAAVNLWLKGSLELNPDFSHALVHQFMHGIYA